MRTLPFTNVDILLGTAPGPFTVMLMADRWTDEGHVSITDTTPVGLRRRREEAERSS